MICEKAEGIKNQKGYDNFVALLIFSDPGKTRTPNLLIRSQMLYPLSYRASILLLKRCKYSIFW